MEQNFVCNHSRLFRVDTRNNGVNKYMVGGVKNFELNFDLNMVREYISIKYNTSSSISYDYNSLNIQSSLVIPSIDDFYNLFNQYLKVFNNIFHLNLNKKIYFYKYDTRYGGNHSNMDTLIRITMNRNFVSEFNRELPRHFYKDFNNFEQLCFPNINFDLYSDYIINYFSYKESNKHGDIILEDFISNLKNNTFNMQYSRGNLQVSAIYTFLNNVLCELNNLIDSKIGDKEIQKLYQLSKVFVEKEISNTELVYLEQDKKMEYPRVQTFFYIYLFLSTITGFPLDVLMVNYI